MSIVPALRVRCTVVGIDGCIASASANIVGCSYW